MVLMLGDLVESVDIQLRRHSHFLELLAHRILGVDLLHLRILESLSAREPHLEVIDGAQLLEQSAHLLLLGAPATGRRDRHIGRDRGRGVRLDEGRPIRLGGFLSAGAPRIGRRGRRGGPRRWSLGSLRLLPRVIGARARSSWTAPGGLVAIVLVRPASGRAVIPRSISRVTFGIIALNAFAPANIAAFTGCGSRGRRGRLLGLLRFAFLLVLQGRLGKALVALGRGRQADAPARRGSGW